MNKNYIKKEIKEVFLEMLQSLNENDFSDGSLSEPSDFRSLVEEKLEDFYSYAADSLIEKLTSYYEEDAKDSEPSSFINTRDEDRMINDVVVTFLEGYKQNHFEVLVKEILTAKGHSDEEAEMIFQNQLEPFGEIEKIVVEVLTNKLKEDFDDFSQEVIANYREGLDILDTERSLMGPL